MAKQVAAGQSCDTVGLEYMKALLKDIAEMDQERGCHAAMARKYRHAARYLWLSVEPDPLDSGP
jgi:hypothetical protein